MSGSRAHVGRTSQVRRISQVRRTSQVRLTWRPRAIILATSLLLVATVSARALGPEARPRQDPTPTPVTTTVKDKVYTKEQATRGQSVYEKVCAKCHALDDKPTANEGPSLAGDAFLNKWDGKSVYALAFGTKIGMPPDGSVLMDDDNTADVVGYLLKVNGFPDGETPLKVDASAKTLLFVKK